MRREQDPVVNQQRCCKIHQNMRITTICISPFCGYYRELCESCCEKELDHAEKYHLKAQNALNHVYNRMKDIEKSMLILKKQKQEKLKTSLINLPSEVKQKIATIRQIINEKISSFQKKLEDIYQREVNLKLQNLEDTIKKSIDFLRRQINELESYQQNWQDLRKYFKNFDYWQHERKYFKSWIEEILQKQIKNFRDSFDNDNIMKLIVSFEVNLKSIFQEYNKSEKSVVIQKPHLFFYEHNELKKVQIAERYNYHFKLSTQLLHRPYPKENYQWIGYPQSVFSPQLNSFYIFGEGAKQSNAIVRFQNGENGNNRLNYVGQMFVKRSCFSICLVKGQVFIVGGYNEKQGCLSKCEKMIVNQKVKMYLVSSLQQRSACHSLINYKNKYILKFGGTSVKMDQNQRYAIYDRTKQLYPQFYDLQKQQWKIIRYNMNKSQKRLQFGLWPFVVGCYNEDQNKIFVFGNQKLPRQNTLDRGNVQGQMSSSQKLSQKSTPWTIFPFPTKHTRNLFQIKCDTSKTQTQFRIKQKTYQLNNRYEIIPQMYKKIQIHNKTKIIIKDKVKNENLIYLIDLDNYQQ